MVIFYINFVQQESQMLHMDARFEDHQTSGSEEDV